MSTPLLPDAVPEIGANPVSFGGGEGTRSQVAKTENEASLLLRRTSKSWEVFSFRGRRL